MDTITTDTTTPDKAITVDVPADRVPEFYAWYARFLAGQSFGGRRRGRHGGHRHHGGPCHHRGHGPEEHGHHEGPGYGREHPAEDPRTTAEPTRADG